MAHNFIALPLSFRQRKWGKYLGCVMQVLMAHLIGAQVINAPANTSPRYVSPQVDWAIADKIHPVPIRFDVAICLAFVGVCRVLLPSTDPWDSPLSAVYFPTVGNFCLPFDQRRPTDDPFQSTHATRVYGSHRRCRHRYPVGGLCSSSITSNDRQRRRCCRCT